MTSLTCSFEFSGYSDYWCGNSGRGCGHGCAFAYYGKDTTLRDLVDQWVEDAWSNEYDFDDLPESVTSDDIRECIVESLTAQGRDDYDSGAICEFSAEWADINDMYCCRECKAPIGEEHEDGCSLSIDLEENEGETSCVVQDDLPEDDDYCESPVAIMEIDWTDHPSWGCPNGCGSKVNNNNVNGLCDYCLSELE